MRLISLFIYLIFFTSCVSHKKEIISKSTIKLEGKNTSAGDLINIDGCYPVNPADRMNGYILFFKDGTWVYFHTRFGISKDHDRMNLSKSIMYKKDKSKEWGTDWGVYKVQNDTIIIHSYRQAGFMVPMGLTEQRYKIVDQNTIQRIYFRVRTDDKYFELNSPWIDDSPKTFFIPADSIPSSDNWLKENKWIWRNESDWEKYMQHIGKFKLQNKKIKKTNS